MYIYIIENKINKKIYVGQTSNLKKRFKEHEKARTRSIFHYAVKKYGWDNFAVKDTIKAASREELNELEVSFIEKLNTLNPSGYNMTPGGQGHSATPWNKGKKGMFSEETIKKMSKARMGKEPWNKGKKGVFHHSEETKKKIGIASRNMSKETIEKIRQSSLGRKHSEETIAKMRKVQKKSEEMKNRISKSLLGHPVSEETRRKISETKRLKKIEEV